MQKDAVIDRTGAFRYSLTRVLETGKGKAVFIMLNPSTADAEQDDPTIRRCIRFAQSWGYQRLEVVNLFAFRATEPKVLFSAPDPVGPENDDWLRKAAADADVIIASWGTHGTFAGRDKCVLKLVADREIHCLGQTQQGHPRHPLYVPASVRPALLHT